MDGQDHKWLALWAANCAERVLSRFEEERPTDARPRKAVEAGRAWARGEIRVSEARTAAFGAHAAAREVDRAEARVAARAAGHAAATVHVATHAPHATAYAVKAAAGTAATASSSSGATDERDWQYRHLPEHLWPVAFPT